MSRLDGTVSMKELDYCKLKSATRLHHLSRWARVSQPWHYWHRGPGNASRWGPVPCVVGCLAASLASVYSSTCQHQRHPLPLVAIKKCLRHWLTLPEGLAAPAENHYPRARGLNIQLLLPDHRSKAEAPLRSIPWALLSKGWIVIQDI